MKKVLTVVLTMLVAGSLAFAQNKPNTGGKKKTNPHVTAPRDASSGSDLPKESTANNSKSHKGGKKGKNVDKASGKRQHEPS